MISFATLSDPRKLALLTIVLYRIAACPFIYLSFLPMDIPTSRWCRSA